MHDDAIAQPGVDDGAFDVRSRGVFEDRAIDDVPGVVDLGMDRGDARECVVLRVSFEPCVGLVEVNGGICAFERVLQGGTVMGFKGVVPHEVGVFPGDGFPFGRAFDGPAPEDQGVQWNVDPLLVCIFVMGMVDLHGMVRAVRGDGLVEPFGGFVA